MFFTLLFFIFSVVRGVTCPTVLTAGYPRGAGPGRSWLPPFPFLVVLIPVPRSRSHYDDMEVLKMTRNEQLQAEFITIAAQIRGIMEKINSKIDNLESHFDPDNLTQADINALLKIRFDLAQASSSISDRLEGWQ